MDRNPSIVLKEHIKRRILFTFYAVALCYSIAELSHVKWNQRNSTKPPILNKKKHYSEEGMVHISQCEYFFKILFLANIINNQTLKHGKIPKILEWVFNEYLIEMNLFKQMDFALIF